MSDLKQLVKESINQNPIAVKEITENLLKDKLRALFSEMKTKQFELAE